jgi:beta-galactosidase
MVTLAQTALLSSLFLLMAQSIAPAEESPVRQKQLLSGSSWQFTGVGASAALPEIGTDAFQRMTWEDVTVPHNFQTRSAFETLAKGWYRRKVTIDPSAAGKELYLVFEGAATIADVYMNSRYLGQHRGGYTRFVFDATPALHPGSDNELDVLVDNSPETTKDCLPAGGPGLYKVWGGLYRKVWLVTTNPVHIDPTDDGAPGVYLTPQNVSADSAQLNMKALLRNTSAADVEAEVCATILDPDGVKVTMVTAAASIAAHQRNIVEMTASIPQPQLWAPGHGRIYHVQTDVYAGGRLVDRVTEPTGFRWVNFDWKEGRVTVNGKPTILAGVNVHQETEEKGSAVADEDLTHNLDVLQDLGGNFVRFSHYPRAQGEYDYCDQLGLMCWAENGNSTGYWDNVHTRDVASPTSAQITTEMVKQNYNHPSIIMWSVGNEATSEPADQSVPIVKALDPSRPVVVANMKSELADYRAANEYPGWYGGDMESFRARGFISEIGAGGLVTIHCDYNQCDWKVNSYEPEEYQQLVAENHFQTAFHGDNSHLGLFCWWTLRDFTDNKYKGPIGLNSKGLLTYAGDKKDVYYLYRCFLRPEEPTLWITSKRYFLRKGAVTNGIKVYSNAPKVTLTLNGEKVSTLDDGQYVIPDGPWAHHSHKKAGQADAPDTAPESSRPPMKVDHVFYWPIPLNTGKNIVTASDDQGHSDTAVIYFYGDKGLPESPLENSPVKDLSSSNPQNPAYYIDAPVHNQWPIYTDLDSTADNSWDSVPAEIKDATWIALRRVTKPGQATDLSFTLTRPMKVYVAASQNDSSADEWDKTRFKATATQPFLWRDNALNLVPAKLFLHDGHAGETIRIPLGPGDAVVLLKESH